MDTRTPLPIFQSVESDSVRHRSFPYHHVLAILLAAFSFVMSGLVSRSVFERLPHLEDEMAYLFQARTLARGQMVIASPDPARPFWQPFVVDLNGKRFGKYSPGWPGLLAAGELMGQEWVINAFLGMLTVALAYRLGREIFDPDTGVMAAALTAFSPMALLLNGTLMGHTAALFTATLFLFAYWRLERGRQALRWGLVAGAALGLTTINRPLAGMAIALPVIAWSGARLMRAWREGERAERGFRVGRRLAPLLALSGATVVICAAIPLYNAAATGKVTQNLYLLVWPYDRVGFGEGYGRNGHTLEKGLRQTRWDLSLTAADLFGWQIGPITEESQQHVLNEADYWPQQGVGWLLVPMGFLIGLRRRWLWWGVWLGAGVYLFTQSFQLPVERLRDPQFAWLWMAGGAAWLLVIPAGYLSFGKMDRRTAWTWLLLAVPLALIGLHVTYWIGSQRYSTRYYFEGLSGLALLGALPLSWLARQWRRWPVYAALTAALIYSLLAYSVPRITPLYRFNWVSPELAAAVEARREGDRPVLVLVSGKDVKWRAYGSLMAVTSPFLDSPIVAAWDVGSAEVRAKVLAMFPERQVIEISGQGNRACFGSAMAGECYGESLAGG